MKRAVVTGMGIVSPLGNSIPETLDALRATRSGIKFQQSYQDMGLRSHIAGSIEIDQEALIDRKLRRFMGDAAAFSYIALREAIEDAALTADQISNERTGIVAGSGGASSSNLTESADILREKGLKRVGPYRVTRTMSSTVSACLATAFAIKGINYSITSACSTSAHCIGHAMELIQLGKQDVVFAGGGEELHWTMSALFDAMGALSSQYNETPERASRAYDANRDGFVIAGGGGMLVVESLTHAKARGANILAELVGYGATSDGYDMVAPSGEGAVRCMQQAMHGLEGQIDYINAHGTSTPLGDVAETEAIKTVFGHHASTLCVSSTKSMIGHALGAAGAIEAVISILALQNDIAPPTINLENPDEGCDLNYVAHPAQARDINVVLSNSFGFGGTNGTVIFKSFAG